jgi:DNA polymerase-1
MLPWLKMAEASDGRIFTTWNQTKLEHGDGTMGTRTGRLSSTPNFQNIPKEFPTMFRHELNQNNKDRVKFPLCPFVGLPTLPLIRKYIVPRARGRVLLDRDYSQQELRVLAHFENGALLAAYNADPWLDVHEYARQMICQMTGKDFDRKVIKTVGFGLIYGMGVGLLAMRGGVTVEVAKEVKQAYLTLFPELRGMYQEMKMRMISRKPIRTWGGREVFCEPSKFIEGRRIDFDYKLVNYLVQGSGADCIKDAIIAYYERKPKDHHLILNVYDQLTVDCPRRQAVMGMRVLREAMEGVKFDVAMLSEGKWSDTNWAELHTFDKKGVSRGLKR